MQATFLVVICLVVGIILPYSEAQVSQEDRNLFLKLHNDVRQKLVKCQIPGQPGAVSIPNLIWDEELAQKAQNWASKCSRGHDPREERRTSKFQQVGQNYAQNRDFTTAFNGWFNEYPYYKLADGSCSKVCGHYTQIVDKRSTHLGCGIARCDGRNVYVCNYGPSQQRHIIPPYEKSSKCK